MTATKGKWVEIEKVILNAEERTANIPVDTKECPLKMWARGFLVTEVAVIGDTVEILTLAERTISGQLVDLNPRHCHDFGDSVVEFLMVGEELKNRLANLTEE